MAGAFASIFVGAGIGWAGRLFVPLQNGRWGLLIAMVVAILALIRELNWIAIPLPQLGRQTKDYWAKRYPGFVVSTLWGFDLGLVFTTWLTFSGVWVIVVMAFFYGEPTYGLILFLAYWLGRVLSVWLAPLLMVDASATPQLMENIHNHYQFFQRVHVLGLIWSIFVLSIWLTQG